MEQETLRRRDFVLRLGGAACGTLFALTCGRSLAAPDPAASPAAGAAGEASGGATAGAAAAGYEAERHRYTMLIDARKCIGCGACSRACTAENQVPEHFYRTWMERYTVSRTGKVQVDSPDGGREGFEPLVTGEDVTRSQFVPKLCNHCAKSPCIQLCPVGASYRSPDGVVMVDEKRCIGCGYCVQACPYGSRFIHPVTHTASKCTWCYHRITKGLDTACVQACPTGARRFGDSMDPDDQVSQVIATEEVHVLKPELLTEPRVVYLGIGREVR